MSSKGRLVLSVLSLWGAGSLALASGELLGVRATVDRQATTFLLRLPARVEYSPTRIGPRLFVVDLTGISTGQSAQSQAVESPLVHSYRLLNYRGADNQPHVALELTLKQDGVVDLEEVPGGLEVRVRSADSTAPATVPPAVPAAPRATAPAAAPSRRITVREVSVAELENGAGLEVEIQGDGSMEYRTMALRGPERLVVDIPNAVNAIRQRHLAVNTPPLRAVRIAQLSRQPAVTRVVMDLDSRVPFTVRQQSKSLLVQLGPSPALESKPRAREDSAFTGSEPSAEAAGEPAGNPEPPRSLASAVPPETTSASNPTPMAAASSPVSPPALAAPLGLLPSEVSPPVLAALASGASPAETPSSSGAPPAAPPEPVLLAQAAPPAGSQAAPSPQPAYTGEPISVNLKDVDLKDFFRLIHEISSLNIVLDPTVSGNITIVLDEVPWDQAMDIVMRNNGLDKEVVGNVVRIAKRSTLKAEEDEKKALAASVEQNQPRETVTRVLSYAQAPTLVPTLKRFLTPRGDLIADARTNMLIITDITPAIAQIDRLIGTLDRKSQQVEIEARIVAASRSFARDIGSQLAASGASGRVLLGGAGLVGESPLKRGITPPLFIGSPPEPPKEGELPKFANVAQPLAVNLPAVGATGGTTLVITTPSFALDAILTAAESRGLGKLLSRPKVVTQNNEEAIVKQGVKIPIQTSINNTITVQFIDVVLRLTVTPQITSEGTIFLRTDVENTAIDPGIPRILGIPALDTQQATTKVLVSNGGTVFFGGVIQTTNNLTEQQVPLLGSVPLVGNLFRRKFTSSDTKELLFFITPRIVQS